MYYRILWEENGEDAAEEVNTKEEAKKKVKEIDQNPNACAAEDVIVIMVGRVRYDIAYGDRIDEMQCDSDD